MWHIIDLTRHIFNEWPNISSARESSLKRSTIMLNDAFGPDQVTDVRHHRIIFKCLIPNCPNCISLKSETIIIYHCVVIMYSYNIILTMWPFDYKYYFISVVALLLFLAFTHNLTNNNFKIIKSRKLCLFPWLYLNILQSDVRHTIAWQTSGMIKYYVI